MPLIPDIIAAGKTPTQLSKDIEGRLREYIKEPNVSVIVNGFQGPLPPLANQSSLQTLNFHDNQLTGAPTQHLPQGTHGCMHALSRQRLPRLHSAWCLT